MKKIGFILLILFVTTALSAQEGEGLRILQAIDKNMSADSRIVESTMIVHGKRNSRTMTSKSYVMGTDKSFSEYLSPARERGTKMLKLDNEMWVYSPSTDRTIMISGHMMRQSVMGSDLSYEDMMDDRKLTEIYNAEVAGNEIIDERDCWLLTLTGKVNDAAYPTRKLWVDKEWMIPLREELYAKSGQLLKKITLSDIRQTEGRWFPMKMIYKDILKDGNGTEWIIDSITFDRKIPEHIFSKASMKK
ncbi:outer membrane lipoprotein-sorting protein [Parabacteroides sp. PF5-9]|uniref:outer membrane lipoprotein-sorting protein n=1 Tax=Parabacteroides sp. PF5-9 TaxID=1742404 RepID=UPI0024735BA0|nr:outer membrane lipoprotein-sorting protein [Parabacteroides sp. PF5-9]